MKHLLSLLPSELEDFFISIGEKPWRARQIYRWIYKNPHNFIQSFDSMTDLSLNLRRQLSQNFYLSSLKLIKTKSSCDGTIRYDFSTSYPAPIARKIFFSSVYIPSSSEAGSKQRNTICLSTQSGCPVGCLFCASATHRNSPIYALTKGEIIESYLITRAMVLSDNGKKGDAIPDNNNEKFAALFMGSGEPFLNYDNVCAAIDALVSEERIGLSARDVVLSTVGIKPDMISRFTKETLNKDKKIRLAVSLHTVDDRLRQKLIPVKNLPLVTKILEEAFNYASSTKTRLTIECVMIKNLTDTNERIKKLADILRKYSRKYHLIKNNLIVNLIPYNQNEHGKKNGFAPSDEKDILRIKNFLISGGIFTIIRSNRGQDISSACGQLDTNFLFR